MIPLPLQVLLVKGDIDLFSGSADGIGELVLSATLLGIAMVWNYYTFIETSSRDSKLRSVMSILGLAIVIISVVCSTPGMVEQLGPNFNVWGFSYGAFLFAFSRLSASTSADSEDGTVKIPIVNICLGTAFLAAGVSSILMETYPSIAFYIVVCTDVLYVSGAVLLFYRFVTF